jgi:hypothetical protein
MHSSAWEKLQGATLSLARSGALKKRITDAYRNHLSLLDETELPKDLREAFRNVSNTLTRQPPLVRGDDAFRATIRKMSNGEAEHVATCVVKMFGAVQQRGTGVLHRTHASAQIVPLYVADSRANESLAAEA